MKKKTLGRIAVFAILLCFVSTSLLSGTLAKYATSVTGTGTVNVAQWSGIKFEGVAKTEDFNFDLATTKDTNGLVKDTEIAPGDKGSFTFTVGPAEVEYSYTAAITGTDLPVSFYSDEDMLEPWTGASKRVLRAAAGTEIVETIYWKWNGANDADDTAEGLILNNSSTFTLSLTAAQELTAAPVEP